MRSLADIFALEETRVRDGEAACGHSCSCHDRPPQPDQSAGSPLTCGRTAHHPDEDGNRSPHLARTADGPVQWSGGCCVDGVPQTTDV